MRDLPSGCKAGQELHERPSVAATAEARLHSRPYLLITITPPSSSLLVHKQYFQQHPPNPPQRFIWLPKEKMNILHLTWLINYLLLLLLLLMRRRRRLVPGQRQRSGEP